MPEIDDPILNSKPNELRPIMNELVKPIAESSVALGSWTFLPTSLLRARDAVTRQFRAILREHDLSEQQCRVLVALARRDRISVLKLARAADLLGPSLSRILRDLDQRGMITRESTQKDLRSALILITAEGRAVIESMSRKAEPIYAKIVARLGVDQLLSLRDLLNHVERHLPR
jgi:homoprotocatechuate degradation regulator HpaR